MHPDCYADAAPAQAGPPPLDVRSLRFREAVRQVFEAPGDWGPAKGYYRGDIDHFIDMLVDRLSRTGEPSDE